MVTGLKALQQSLQDKLSNITFENVVEKISNGNSYQDILEISNETMQKFYDIALEYSHNQHYSEAADCFIFLCALNPFESNLWIRLGNAEQAMKNHHDALTAYSMAMLCDADDPFPHFYSAQSHSELHEKHEAKDCINICMELINEHIEFIPLRQEALKLMDYIEKH